MSSKKSSKSKGTTDNQDRPIHLLVSEERSGSCGERYFHLRARVVVQTYLDGCWQAAHADDDYSDGPLWSHLRASCQGDERSQRKQGLGENGPVYGFDTLYKDVYSVDRRRARRMSKTLDRVDRGLGQLSEARGYVRSFGEYLGRLAEVLGCQGIGFEKSARRQHVSGTRVEWMTIGDGVNHANHLIYLWQREVLEPEEVRERRQLTAGDEAATAECGTVDAEVIS